MKITSLPTGKSRLAAIVNDQAGRAVIELEEAMHDICARHGANAVMLAFLQVFWRLIQEAREEWILIMCAGARRLSAQQRKLILEKLKALT